MMEDAAGRPWVSPVYFAHAGFAEFFWVSSPDATHSRNIAARPEVGIVVFDSQVAIGTGQGVYMPAIAKLLEKPLGDVLGHAAAVALAVAIGYAILTILHITFGELVPKIYTVGHAEGVARRFARPLEFFTVEDMVGGYYRILRSVMFTLDEAAEKPKEPERLNKALKNLKDRTEKDLKSLQILKKMAEEKQKEELWNLVNQALEIADGAREGAETGLARFKATGSRKTKG